MVDDGVSEQQQKISSLLADVFSVASTTGCNEINLQGFVS
jgi:hypothetical protein